MRSEEAESLAEVLKSKTNLTQFDLRGPPSDRLDIYNTLNGRWSVATLSLSQPRCCLANLVLFGGGYNSRGPFKVVDVFNVTNNTWSATTLSQARYYLSASSIGEIVAFGRGWNGSTPSSVVDMLNVTSNIWFTAILSQPRDWLASTSSTNKIFFGGGLNSSGNSDVVDIFEISLPPPLLPTSSFSSSNSPISTS